MPSARPQTYTRALLSLAGRIEPWAILVIAAIGGAASGLVPNMMARLIVAIVATLLAWFVVARPAAGMTFTLGLLVLVPLVAFPFNQPFGVSLHPGLVLLWWLAAIGLIRSPFGGSAFDLGILICVAGVVLSTLLGEHPQTDAFEQLWVWVGPYLAGRQFVLVAGHTRTLLIALVLATLATVPFALTELAGITSLLDIFPWGTNVQAGLGIETSRLGEARVQGSLAQPIPFAIVVSCGAIAAAVLALLDRGALRRLWMMAVPLLVAAQALALARTGWLLMIVTAMLATAHRGLRRKIVSARTLTLTAVVAIIVISPFGGPTLDLFANSESDPLVAASSEYRSELVAQAISGGIPHPFGTTAPIIGPGGAVSIDNLYIWLSWTWGVLPVIGLFWIAIAALIALFRLRSPYAALLAALTLSLIIIHWNVVFLAQQEIITWLIFGATAGALARERLQTQPDDRRPARSAAA